MMLKILKAKIAIEFAITESFILILFIFFLLNLINFCKRTFNINFIKYKIMLNFLKNYKLKNLNFYLKYKSDKKFNLINIKLIYIYYFYLNKYRFENSMY
ncbi:hypothetical protein THJ076_15180 [Campylobacter jejuni]|nr:hypothetical protein THJ005_13350 [Campylobacter jejuni]GKY16410.1 hypothetical protein THJ050_14270 [Campylobacter jejuni]GKY43591.1 hypothetical protein THJ076_15180 [Campylobacter jejuni]